MGKCLFLVLLLLYFTPSFAGILSPDDRNQIKHLINNDQQNNIASTVLNILNNMKTIVQNKEPKIIEKLDQLSKQSEPGNNFYERYGSVAGNEYFQMYYSEFIEPVLSEFLTIIGASTIQEKHNPQLYYGIVKWLGQERALVAENTSTVDAYQFGKLLNNEFLMDPVFHDSFPNWNKTFRLALLEDIKNNWKTLYKIIIKNEQKDFVYPVKIDALPKEESFLYRRKEFKYGFQCVEHNNQSWGMCNKLKWYITIIDPSDEPLHTWITLEIYSYKAFQYKTFAEFENALLATDKDNSLSIGIQVVHPLYAAIGNHSPEDSVKEVEKLVLDSLTTILSEKPLSEDHLKEELAKLLRFFSVMSTFRRGQAAITDWLLKSLAKARGYELTFSDKWRGPNYPNPDMHALMEFDIQTLIQEFKANTELKPSAR